MKTLSIPPDIYAQLLAAMGWSGVEQVAFLFTEPAQRDGSLRVREIYRVPAVGFEVQSDLHVSLTDETRAYVIKRAADSDSCLVEAHSHKHGPAKFSRSDLLGFTEWVPHVRWRLQQRPYTALVQAGRQFDALVWEGAPGAVTPLEALQVDGQKPLTPTGLTYRELTAKQR
jgi:proteasome lid subunit RPN8/RPN11